jgi:hypothetical protein
METTGQNAAEIPYISSEHEFAEVCQLPKAIIYIQVDWSEQERLSRQIFQDVLAVIDRNGVPVFKIDCSSQQQEYFENWLIVQKQHVHLFYSGGYGEILLVQNGEVADFINFPGKSGFEETKAKIQSWLL